MLSLLVVVFLVQLAIYLINTIGASTIDNLVKPPWPDVTTTTRPHTRTISTPELWIIYLKLPHQTSRTAREQVKLKREVVQLKREMNATSSQDEFAKWAKLRRRHDKTLEEYEAKNKSLSTFKTSFDMTVKTGRWLGTNGLKFFLQFWYSKVPIFDLPQGWVPWYVEWILSFPRAPWGTVSIQVWGAACAATISVVGEAVGSVVVYMRTKEGQAAPAMRVMKVSSGAAGKTEKSS
ncbi:GET complex subunit get1 [Arachnomyces sp. PD_36]|nr:GET complex subunit get1 [Arachnomyces sp. PD_36]